MSPPKDSRFDRRIEEIERELKRVQKTMREVESGRRKPGIAPAQAAAEPSRPWRPPFGSPRESSAAPDAPSGPVQGELFHAPGRSGPASAGTGQSAQSARPLAHYLSSGGFMGSPLRRDQRQMKAKAIFMLIVLALGIFVLWRVFFS